MHSLKHGRSKADIHLWLNMLSSCCAWRLKPAFKLMLGNAREVEKSGFAPDGLPLLSSLGPVQQSNSGQSQSRRGARQHRRNQRVVSSTFPPDSYLLERRIWFFASVFFSFASLKEGGLGLFVKGDFRTGMLTEEVVLFSNSQVLSFLA